MPPSTSAPTIKILPPELTTLIAAGEVVERPASVVKELLENALDAGASAINIELQDGGLALIRVSDDGCGMNRADAELAGQPFATSKINAPADLEAIRTFGFRGEALSSIAAVARLDILTRTGTELEGTRAAVRGAAIDIAPAASPVGTSVTITQLFAAIPARRKFLKAPLRELELTRRVVQKYALACPQVAFRLADGGRPRLALPPGTPLERIGAVFGREAAAEMIAVQWQAMDMRITGFISPPALARSRRDRQYFFVNGRPVRSGLLAVMLERPYAGLLPPGRYPLAVIHIQLDPGFVDVNVHPQKAEVRFSRERSVYGALSQAVSNALSDFPRLALAGEDSVTWPFEGQAGFVPFYNPETPAQLDSLRPLAQIHNSYILAQSDDGVLIIDQHAAHEQILFEQVTAGAAGAEIGPTQLELTAAEAGLLTGHLPLFAGLGFELEPFGERVFLLRRVPAALKPHLSNQVARSTQPGEAILLATLLEELQTCKTNAPEVQRDRLAQKGACVCAVKTGDVLSPKTMQTLLDDLLQLWSPAACPHGRPVFVSLSLAELERRFGRR